jgi:IstB-like ATP binding protein
MRAEEHAWFVTGSGVAADALGDGRDVLHLATVVNVQRLWSESELARAEDCRSDPRIAAAAHAARSGRPSTLPPPRSCSPAGATAGPQALTRGARRWSWRRSTPGAPGCGGRSRLPCSGGGLPTGSPMAPSCGSAPPISRRQGPRGLQPRPPAQPPPRRARPPGHRRLRRQAENVILLGPPGIDKTHLAIGLGVKAAHAGYSVLFPSPSRRGIPRAVSLPLRPWARCGILQPA